MPAGAFSPRGFRRVGLAVGIAFLAACGSAKERPIRPEFDLHDPSATRRSHAVAQVATTRDRSQVPALIILLNDEDEAVRLAAGRALRDVTGHDTGYRASAPPEERARQLELWRAWWGKDGRGTAPPPPPAPAPAPAAGGHRAGAP